jgi:hypothetical protein
MKKWVGYIISIAGLAVLVVAVGLVKFNLGILGAFEPYFMIAGVVLVVVGVVLAMMDKNGKKSNEAEELPIFEGTGKKRKIVGYRRG